MSARPSNRNICKAMCRDWLSRTKMFEMFQRESQRRRSGDGSRKRVANRCLENCRRGFGTKVDNQLSTFDRLFEFERKLGHEVVSNKIHRGNLAQAGVGI